MCGSDLLARAPALHPDIAELIESAETLTAKNTALNLAFAFNYGSREELADAAQRAGARGRPRASSTRRALPRICSASSMQSAGIPDADLVIRSGGERRLSNFLLWQAAYAELVFTDKLWPDFGAEDLEAALAEFARRERRFGGVPSDRSRAAELADAQLRGMFGRVASKD